MEGAGHQFSCRAELARPGPSTAPLLERDSELAALRSYWDEAQTGRGRVVFLGGEAGAGKSSVTRHLAAQLSARARVLVGFCDGGSAPRPLGPLLDVAAELGLADALGTAEVSTSWLHTRVRAALGRTPTIFVVEDVHWADEATLRLLGYLARRMEGLPLLMIATFRDDEVVAGHPLTVLMGDLATATGTARMRLPLLTVPAVATLARRFDRTIDVEALHRSTAGNPFFVIEVLAATTDQLPTTVRDAVTARTARLSEAGRRVLDTAAVIGPSAEIGLLLAACGETSDSVDECVGGGVLLDQGLSVAFRHDLARQAILDTISPGRRLALHRRVLAQLLLTGCQDHRRLAHHAVACGDAAAVIVHAPLAAEQAVRLGSHREAAHHLRTALRYGDAMPAAQRTAVLEQLSYECYLTSQLAEAVEARRTAVALHEAAGNRRGVGVGQRWLSRFTWYLGLSTEAQRLADAAVTTLEALGPSGDLAMAYSNLSQLQMLGGAPEGALTWGRRALESARTAGDREVEAHAANNIGSALVLRGDLVEGLALLERSLEISLTDDLEEHATRAWINIGTLQFSKRLLGNAERTLRTGIAFCAERDLISSTLYLQARLAQVLLEQGVLDEAARLAGETLRHPHASTVSRVAALLTTGTIAVRTGDPTAESQVAELQVLARRTGEPQRLLPVALLTAEAAWTAGRTADIVPLTDEVWLAYRHWEPWILAELAWWRRLGGAEDEVPSPLPPPFALLRTGRLRESSDAWKVIGRPFWAALSLVEGGPSDRSEAVAHLLRLGAPASAQAVRRELARRGLPVPRGPRRAARTNAAGLTARQLDVLDFLVEGLSDGEIAHRLTLSERTVGHHVSAVLRKLGVPSRSRAVAAAGALAGARQPR